MSLVKNDGTVIAADVELADTFLKRSVGLMFRRSLGGALVFDMGGETYDGIHMLFVRFPIDVIFLGPDKTVIGTRPRLRPWTGIAFPPSRFRYAIELPAGTVEKASVGAGDRLQW